MTALWFAPFTLSMLALCALAALDRRRTRAFDTHVAEALGMVGEGTS